MWNLIISNFIYLIYNFNLLFIFNFFYNFIFIIWEDFFDRILCSGCLYSERAYEQLMRILYKIMFNLNDFLHLHL